MLQYVYTVYNHAFDKKLFHEEVLVENISLRRKAIKNILNKISTAEIAPNQIITESQLCNELNMSRTPVREALIELTASGILGKVPHRGYRVVEMDSKEKLDIYTILGTLDALAAQLAMDHITEEDIYEMKEVIDLIDVAIKYKNYASYVELQERFHDIYIKKCENDQLKKMLDEIKITVSRYTYYSEDEEALFALNKDLNQQHRQIVEYFKKKDRKGLNDFLLNVHWKTVHFDMI